MTRPLINEVHYVRIPVTDLDAAVDWYTRCLGLDHLWTNDGMAMVKSPAGAMLVLMKADEGSHSHFTVDGKPRESITLTSAEIRELYSHLKANGVTVDELIQDANGHLLFHFFDLCGNMFQVHW